MAVPDHFSSQSSSSSAGATLAAHYDVFLSFRGPDARYDFADGLYQELTSAGIRQVFRDKEEIYGGDDINASLIKAIERSDISIPIISPRYAESKACLMELAHMSLCRKTKGHKVIPIFYDVETSILKDFPRELKIKLGKSTKLAEIFPDSEDTIKDWMEALLDLASKPPKYRQLSKASNRYWSDLFYEVVSDVQAHLRMEELEVTDKLIGIEHHVEEMMRMLGIVYNNGLAVKLCGKEIPFVAISGIPGIGKTTLAKVIFNKIHHLFESRSFLENIQEFLQHDLCHSLLQQLISDLNKREIPKRSNYAKCIRALKSSFKDTRVLIVLDDVDDIDDVQALVGQCNWFGPGSRIVITTNNIDLAGLFQEAKIYRVVEMNDHLAVQLFLKHAYGHGQHIVPHEFQSFAEEIIDVIRGIPLVIEVVGRALYKQGAKRWEEFLNELKNSPPETVYRKFDVVYNKILDVKTRQIFLDIACFFVGSDKKIAEYMWHAREFSPLNGIQRLCNMSWVRIKENNELSIPDQLQSFGKEIVRNEHEHCWRRSRVWKHQDAKSILEDKKGTDEVKALGLKCEEHDVRFTNKHFKGLSSLLFLKLDKAIIGGNFKRLLPSLTWLDWQGCPAKTKRLRYLNLAKLVILDLSESQVDHQWNGWKVIMEKAKLLQVLKLKCCNELLESPDFRRGMNLERLILEGCLRLSMIRPSIINLQKLKSLNLKSCEWVGILPDLGQMPELEELLIDGTSITEFHLQQNSMKKLEILSARGCGKLKSLPNSIGELECLTQLLLDGASEIDRLPCSITSLKKLRVFSVSGCKRIRSLPEDIGNLESLEKLELSETSIAQLPPSVRKLENLIVLKMRRTRLVSFPGQVTSLRKLQVMDLRSCWNLRGEIPSDIKGLSSLCVLRLSSTAISSLPASIAMLFHLRVLELCECPKQLRGMVPDSLNDRVIQCPVGSHHDHGEFSQFEYSFS